ncbi:MAG: alpha/beta fold hydrolase [Anaerolineales bacterium]|nr:alpha/beta fold hydrolase [Anaerolineales bacterium]
MNPDTLIIPTAEPFFFPGMPDHPGCLLIHGFTGAPKEMRWMGEYLGAQGYPSLGVRLFGHATRPEDMIRSRYTDWIASVEDGYHLLRDVLSQSKDGLADRIYLVGLSMGGILSLLMSTKLDVVGVVAMSTPYRIPYDYPVWMIKPLSKLVRYQPKSKEEPGAGWFDKDAYAAHVSYPQNPVRSGAELQQLVGEMRMALPKVSVPVLLIHSRNDTYVLPESMERIYADLGAPDKTKLYVTEAGHVVTRDAARDQVFAAASEFIRRIEAAA